MKAPFEESMAAVVGGLDPTGPLWAMLEGAWKNLGSGFVSWTEASDLLRGDVLPERLRACVASVEFQYAEPHASWSAVVEVRAADPRPAEAKPFIASVNLSAAMPSARSKTLRADRPLDVTVGLVLTKGPGVLLFHGPAAGELKIEFPRLDCAVWLPLGRLV